MGKLIQFDDGTIAFVVHRSEIRTKLTRKQAKMLMNTIDRQYVRQTNEELWIQHPDGLL
jgi:hypothetical protein